MPEEEGKPIKKLTKAWADIDDESSAEEGLSGLTAVKQASWADVVSSSDEGSRYVPVPVVQPKLGKGKSAKTACKGAIDTVMGNGSNASAVLEDNAASAVLEAEGCVDATGAKVGSDSHVGNASNATADNGGDVRLAYLRAKVEAREVQKVAERKAELKKCRNAEERRELQAWYDELDSMTNEQRTAMIAELDEATA